METRLMSHKFQTYYLCIFATLSELLHSVGMLYVVHRDCIDHHDSIIFSGKYNKNSQLISQYTLVEEIYENLEQEKYLIGAYLI